MAETCCKIQFKQVLGTEENYKICYDIWPLMQDQVDVTVTEGILTICSFILISKLPQWHGRWQCNTGVSFIQITPWPKISNVPNLGI